MGNLNNTLASTFLYNPLCLHSYILTHNMILVSQTDVIAKVANSLVPIQPFTNTVSSSERCSQSQVLGG